MVIDTSAIVAILQGESERRRFIEILEDADSRRLSVASLIETSMIIESRYGSNGLRELDTFLSRGQFEFVPVDVAQAYRAREGFSRFGKGRHRAGLNYGDCFAYALAITLGEPLLCKGDDFVHTDVAVVG